jgi:hypothetical protein
LARQLESITTVYVACGLTLALGLVFVFVWAPHPWTWQGIDQYHELARALARGEPFGTTDVPWGYAYYVAALYAIFGEHAWIPVALQAIINAFLPLLLYILVQPLAGQRVAVLSAVLTGLLSFNTVYASTQSTDSICTVLFIAALVVLARAIRTQRTGWFAAAGILLGVAPQFRPNLILFPLLAAGLYMVWQPRHRRKLGHAVVMLAMVALALAPWVVRNYRLTGLILPTSTHGAVQLWYGTLQVGPYLENRAANPASAFEPASFDYTSIIDQPLVVRARGASCGDWDDATVHLAIGTDRAGDLTRLSPVTRRGNVFDFEMTPPPAPATLYYFMEARWPGEDRVYTTPLRGNGDPWVFFVSNDHLNDLDRDGAMLDFYDIVRMIRAAAWDEAVGDERTDFDGNGRIDTGDLARAVAALLPSADEAAPEQLTLDRNADQAVLRLLDDSLVEVPRRWSGKVTDVTVSAGRARSLVHTRRTWPTVLTGTPRPAFGEGCRLFEDVTINDVFYRREVHAMQRYTALALDNIRRDPLAFLAASGYRMLRLFVVRGSADRDAVQQFESSGVVYAVATGASAAYLMLFVAGVIVAWRQRQPLLILLVPILYVPLTICFVLTNMRYTITMQPLVFAFIATALVQVIAPRSRRS